MSDVSYEELKRQFRLVREQIMPGQGSSLTLAQLEEDQAKCSSVIEIMTSENNYEHFEEAVNYQELYK